VARAPFAFSDSAINSASGSAALPHFLINAMITILASNPYITSWNTIQLSESYSISFLVLLISISLRLKFNNSVKLKFYLILVLTLFLNTKPSNLISLIITVSFFTIFNLRKLIFQKPNKIFIIIIILVIAYSSLLSFNQSKQKLQDQDADIVIVPPDYFNVYEQLMTFPRSFSNPERNIILKDKSEPTKKVFFIFKISEVSG
jgi:hypothetical protein